MRSGAPGPRRSVIRSGALLAASIAALLVGRDVVAIAAIAKDSRPMPVRRITHPDFTGTWALDTARSEFGDIPGGRPLERTDVIEHRDPLLNQTLYLVNPTGRDTTAYRYTTDGARVVHRVGNRDIEARVWWEGSTLCLLSKSKLLTFDMTLGERWKLSDDAKILTMTRRLKYPLGEGDQKLVFVKR